MKLIIKLLIISSVFFCIAEGFSQDFEAYADTSDMLQGLNSHKPSNKKGDNGFYFSTFPTQINTKYSDYGIGFFRDKFISFSARKIGGLAKIDRQTNEPYTKLYCSNIHANYDLSRPLLFSSLLNKNENLGTLTFANDGNTLYFTKSKENDTQSFNLYRAEMSLEREGAWTNITKLDFNGETYSIENPHVSRDGKLLYFASNSPEALGGFDIFKVSIQDDRPSGKPSRIDGSVNTVLDEKFPQTSLDGEYLYFSSQGHDSEGGFDVFRSKKAALGYVAIRNLGKTINTPKDEVAFIPATQTIGYLTSNREGGEGSYDIYKIEETPINVRIAGTVIDSDTKLPLANATVVLLDENGEEVNTSKTRTDGSYDFPADAYLEYTVLSYKKQFERTTTSVMTASNENKVFKTDLFLKAKGAPIVVSKEKTVIKIDNIQFDYDSAKIKEVSTITLNSVLRTMVTNPEIRIEINAHTDQQGSAAYNLKLSNERASATMDYLIKKGISKSRMTSRGLGESQPLIICEDCTHKENEINRRVEFIVLPSL